MKEPFNGIERLVLLFAGVMLVTGIFQLLTITTATPAGKLAIWAVIVSPIMFVGMALQLRGHRTQDEKEDRRGMLVFGAGMVPFITLFVTALGLPQLLWR